MAVLLQADSQHCSLAELDAASEQSHSIDKGAASTASSQAQLRDMRRTAALPGMKLPNRDSDDSSVLVPYWRFERAVQCTAEVQDDSGKQQTARASAKGDAFFKQVRVVPT
jgi:hypothetical protein